LRYPYSKIKSQISRFSAKMSKDLDKPKRKFIHQMIYGIQASKDGDTLWIMEIYL